MPSHRFLEISLFGVTLFINIFWLRTHYAFGSHFVRKVLDVGGNIIDAISMATRAALARAVIPKVTVIEGDRVGDFELELANEDEGIPIPIDNVPILVTFTQVRFDFDGDSQITSKSQVIRIFYRSGTISSLMQHRKKSCVSDLRYLSLSTSGGMYAEYTKVLAQFRSLR